MSTRTDNSPAFASSRVLALLVGVAWLAWALLRVLLPQAFGGAVTRAVDVAALAAGGGAVVGLLPVAAMARGGVMSTVWGYFMGAVGRAVIALATLVLASRQDVAIEPMAVALVLIYLPLLGLEAGFVGRYLWRLDDRLRSVGAVVKGNA